MFCNVLKDHMSPKFKIEHHVNITNIAFFEQFERIVNYFSSKQVNNFKSMFNDTNGHQLLAVVSTVHHERASQTLYNWTQSLVKSFDLITTCRVWYIFGSFAFNWDVILFFFVGKKASN